MRLTAVLTAALLALPAGPVAAQANQTGAFNVSFGGVRIGTLAFSGIERDGQYAVSGELQTAGLVNWFAQLRFDAQARGRLTAAGFQPSRFEVEAQDGDSRSRTVIEYRGGVPQTPVRTPPRQPRSTDVDPAAQGGTLDMLTALYATLRDVEAESLCDLNVVFYDGARRGRVALNGPRENGSVVECRGEFQRLAGYTPRQMSEQASFPFIMSYMPNGNGTYRVNRVVVDASYGKAVLVRR